MHLWTSSEIYIAAETSSETCRKLVTPYVNNALAISSLATLDVELRYIPIIMPEGMRERYPARSKLRLKSRIYDCAPQLDYDVFIEGSFRDQLKEYVRGIALSTPFLDKFGATDEQVADFSGILDRAVERILLRLGKSN